MRSRPGSKRKPPPHAFATTSPFTTGCYALDAACDAQPFIEEDQPILRAFPRREVASLLVAWLTVLLLCAAGAVVGMQLLLS